MFPSHSSRFISILMVSTSLCFISGQSAKADTTASKATNPKDKQALNEKLIAAVQRKDSAQAKLLLSQGANPNYVYDHGLKVWSKNYSQKIPPAFVGTTPLLIAVYQGDIATMKVLLDAKADINKLGMEYGMAVDTANGKSIYVYNGVRPLHQAITRQNLSVVQFLIAKGVNVNAKDGMGFAPLSLNDAYKPSSENQSPEGIKNYIAIETALKAAGAKPAKPF